jgi:hypothetical protein
MDRNEVKLSDWIDEQKRELDKFYIFWIENQNSIKADYFPSELCPGEWDEQYSLFNDLNNYLTD